MVWVADNFFFSKQSIDHYITYSVISSQPALSYTSVVSTIRAYPVTSGQHEGHTFITWTGNFSSDADAGMYCLFFASTTVASSMPTYMHVYVYMCVFVCLSLCLGIHVFLGDGTRLIRILLGVIEDAKFKRREALADLAKAVAK